MRLQMFGGIQRRMYGGEPSGQDGDGTPLSQGRGRAGTLMSHHWRGSSLHGLQIKYSAEFLLSKCLTKNNDIGYDHVAHSQYMAVGFWRIDPIPAD